MIKWRIDYHEGREQPYTLWSNRHLRNDTAGRRWHVERFFETEQELYAYRKRLEERVLA